MSNKQYEIIQHESGYTVHKTYSMSGYERQLHSFTTLKEALDYIKSKMTRTVTKEAVDK